MPQIVLKGMEEGTCAVMLKHVHSKKYEKNTDTNVLGAINSMGNSSMWKCLIILVFINEF